MNRILLAFVFLFFSFLLLADGPGDNLPGEVRRIPKLGVEVPLQDRLELTAGLGELGRQLSLLERKWARDEFRLGLVSDVEIFHRAVRSALENNEFFKTGEIKVAKDLLKEGRQRAAQLLNGEAPWLVEKGLVVRGYRSRIDGSVQPYGLVVPDSWQPGGPHQHRLDFWFHGRGETLSELNFIQQRTKQVGHFQPADTFVLHPYGRYSNANKFAGEIDLFEALEHAKAHYPIDEDRISVRGFSMGGAACWQFAVHYADRWFAASPGAGFSETPEFLKVFQGEDLKPTWYERKLWHLYDCVDWAVNLSHCPTIAYSGEVDRQKQAADMMEKALSREGIDLVHLIGPGMGHKYDDASKLEIERRLQSIAKKGRETHPDKVRLVTYTLRYNRMHWVTVDALESHWERASVEATVGAGNLVAVGTTNVSEITLTMDPGTCTMDVTRPVRMVIDGREVASVPRVQSDRSWVVSLVKNGGWRVKQGAGVKGEGLSKKHGLQGPIDDAFMDSFIFVLPTGKAWNPALESWAADEASHAIEHWRRQFRGEARIAMDHGLTSRHVRDCNLVIFGDPGSNRILAEILDRLPVSWNMQGLEVAGKRYASDQAVPVMVFPNPLNPERYVVLNSGFTYREYDYLNNARQVPKLPDWAVIDVKSGMTSQGPGKVLDAGFFDEKWRFPKK